MLTQVDPFDLHVADTYIHAAESLTGSFVYAIMPFFREDEWNYVSFKL